MVSEPVDQPRSELARLDSPAWAMAYTPTPATITNPFDRMRPSGPSDAGTTLVADRPVAIGERSGVALEPFELRQEEGRGLGPGQAFERSPTEFDVGLELVAHLAVGDELADLDIAGRNEQGLPHGRRTLDAHRDGDEGVKDPAGPPVLRLGPPGHEQPPHPERSLFGPDLVDRGQAFAELAID